MKKPIYRRPDINAVLRGNDEQKVENGFSPDAQITSESDQRRMLRTSLPPRQAAVAELVMAGLCDCEIAAALGLSEETVGSYLKIIFRRYDVHTRTALAILLMRETASSGTLTGTHAPAVNVGIFPSTQIG